jgi:hypothetical protein
MSNMETPAVAPSATKTPISHVMRAMENRSVISWNPSGEKTTCTGCPYASIGPPIESRS